MSKPIGYVLSYPADGFTSTPVGETEYYCQSAAQGIDRTDVRNAKIFPNNRVPNSISVGGGLTWCPANAEVHEVLSIDIKLGKKVR